MKRLLITLGVAIGVFVTAEVAFLNIGHAVSATNRVRHVDVLYVASGDADQRLPFALDMARRGLASEVWLTVSDAGPVLNEPAAVTTYVAEHAPSVKVVVIGSSRSMRMDAEAVAHRIASGEKVTTLGVVTAPWTATRARLTFDRLIAGRASVEVFSDGAHYDESRWWRSAVETTVIETVKLGGTLAVFGARPITDSQDVPWRLPVRAGIGGFVGALLAGWVVRPIARRLGLVSVPRLWRAGTTQVPLLGGVAILAGLGIGVVAAGGLSVGPAGAVAAGGVILLAVVGLFDDLAGLGAWTRLLWSAIAGGAAWLLGLRTVIIASDSISAQAVNLAVTVIWFVGVTHAVNVLDNLDGAAGGVAAVSAITIAVIAFTSGQWVVAVGAAALGGACIGYLMHNNHPARLFMGDLGALAVGFALASLGLAMRPTQVPPTSFFVAVFALGVPIFDTVLVTVARIKEGRPVSVGGTDHTAHRLLSRGYSVRKSAGVLRGAQAVVGVAAVIVANATTGWAWIVIVAVAASGLYFLTAALRTPAWRPPTDRTATSEILPAVNNAITALDGFVEVSGGLATSDPATVRTATEALDRLRRTKKSLSSD